MVIMLSIKEMCNSFNPLHTNLGIVGLGIVDLKSHAMIKLL